MARGGADPYGDGPYGDGDDYPDFALRADPDSRADTYEDGPNPYGDDDYPDFGGQTFGARSRAQSRADAYQPGHDGDGPNPYGDDDYPDFGGQTFGARSRAQSRADHGPDPYYGQNSYPDFGGQTDFGYPEEMSEVARSRFGGQDEDYPDPYGADDYSPDSPKGSGGGGNLSGGGAGAGYDDYDDFNFPMDGFGNQIDNSAPRKSIARTEIDQAENDFDFDFGSATFGMSENNQNAATRPSKTGGSGLVRTSQFADFSNLTVDDVPW
jgi:hypothetical protein